MSNSTNKNDLKQPKGIELLFKVYPWFAGYFLVVVEYDGEEWSGTFVPQSEWLNEETCKEWMNEIGVYVWEKLIKPEREAGRYGK